MKSSETTGRAIDLKETEDEHVRWMNDVIRWRRTVQDELSRLKRLSHEYDLSLVTYGDQLYSHCEKCIQEHDEGTGTEPDAYLTLRTKHEELRAEHERMKERHHAWLAALPRGPENRSDEP